LIKFVQTLVQFKTNFKLQLITSL